MDIATPALVDSDSSHEDLLTPERLNVRLSPEVRKALDWVAANRGITAVDAIRRSIGTEKFFLELSNQKAKIFVQLPGEKNLKEVMFMDHYTRSA
jgi:hypothetical protein